MKSTAFLLVVLALAASPAFGQKVFIDHDTEYDHGSIKTFMWKKTADTPLAEKNPLLHSRIVSGIEHYLTMGGIAEVETDPDVYVTYHGSSETEISFHNHAYPYVYPISWGYGGYYSYYGYPAMGVGVGVMTTTTVYKKGTLIVDVWDAHTNELIWRGLVAELKVTEVAETMAKRVDKGLARMVKEWQKIKKKNARQKAQDEK